MHREVLPHFGVHRGTHDDRRSSGQQSVGEQVCAEPGCVCSDDMRCSRGHDNEVGALAKLGVRDGRCLIPQAGLHRLARQRRKRGTTNKTFGAFGHDGHHMGACIDQSTTQIDCLVRSNTAGYSDDNGLAVYCRHGEPPSQTAVSASSAAASSTTATATGTGTILSAAISSKLMLSGLRAIDDT